MLKNSPLLTDLLYPPTAYFLVGGGWVQGVQEHYNFHHAMAHCIIDQAFSMMKTRWRSIFFKALKVDPTFVLAIITCCAALHNICLGFGDIVQDTWRDNVDQAPCAVAVSGARSGDHHYCLF